MNGRSARRILLRLGFSFLSALPLAFSGQQSPQAVSAPPGAKQFATTCSVCHGMEGAGSDRAPALANNRRLRTRSQADIANIIRKGTPGGMPAFHLPEPEIDALAQYVRQLNATAFEAKPAGDAAAGEHFFFGPGNCASCHIVFGRGSENGPDLSNVARELTVSGLEAALIHPNALITPGYRVVDVKLKDGHSLRGFARAQGSHDLILQTFDGAWHSLLDTEYTGITEEKNSLMPAVNASPDELRDLIAYLSRLAGAKPGPLASSPEPPDPNAFKEIQNPKPGDWPTYYGKLSGNRYSDLAQIETKNVGRLAPQWTYSFEYYNLETTPLVVDGFMYVTGPNEVVALDARTGREIWRYSRPRTTSGIAGDAAKGSNRGAALSGNRIFFATDNAHLLCLNRLTGVLQWDVTMPEEPQRYGATAAPLVIGDLVISGVAGGDEGIRGFIAAYHVATGQLAWRFWTVPLPGEPGSETWSGTDTTLRGGSTWLTGTYDPETGLLYWPTGNPFPDTDGTERKGDNLYTDCDVALDLATGKLKWYFQYTPHDLHDWDSVQPPVLVDARFHGRDRKLLLHANRSGFFYVLDRTDGKLLLAEPFVKKLTWASGVGADGRPVLLPNNETTKQEVKTCPAVRGATNWYSPAFSPQTGLFYLMAVEDCGVYREAQQGGFGFLNNPADPGKRYLRALNIQTGKIAWEIPQIGPVERNYSGVLATAGGLVFYGETSGGFAAVDAKTGRTLWHFETNSGWKASPMTYLAHGRQYVAIAGASTIFSFALPQAAQ